MSSSVESTALPPPLRQRRPPADEAMRRLLRIPDDAERVGEPAARRAFSRSIFVSAVRCLLTYVVLPFVAPALGWASGVGPVPGLIIGVVAIWFNIVSIRRFWLADHRWRWGYTAVGVAVIGLLSILMVEDLATLLG